jgi:hypothetical protein
MRATAVRSVLLRRSLFKIRFSDEAVVFNRELRMDLGLDVIDCEPSLHIIDAGTGFLAAVFLDGQDSSTVWNAFVMCRSCLFIVLGIILRWARVKSTTALTLPRGLNNMR